MPKSKISIVKKFIETALGLSEYPKSLFWVDEGRRMACIHLLNQHNKEKARETTKMLEDYAKLRPRKNENDGGSNRQRFLQAIKHSPYIKILPCSTGNEKEKIYIHLKETNEISPGTTRTIRSDPVAGPSGMHETDASVPQMIEEEHFENPPTPFLHESEEILGSTPSNAAFAMPMSPLPDFDSVKMDFQLIGSEHLIENDVQHPVDPPSDRNPYSEVFSDDRMPDLSDVAALESVDMYATESEDYVFFPSNYDPTAELLQSLNSTQTSFGLGVNQDSVGSNTNLYDIDTTWIIDNSENGIKVCGRVDSNGINTSDPWYMVLLRPHQEGTPNVEPNQTRQS